MNTWGISLFVLMILVVCGGCSSSGPEGNIALSPDVDVSDSDARGTSALTWGTPTVLDSTVPICDPGTSIATIGGNPAVAYQMWSDQGSTAGFNVYYVRANDPAGSSWGDPVSVDFWPYPHSYNMHTSLCEVNGRPAIAYNAMPNGSMNTDLYYVRARDATGTRWGTPSIVNPPDTDYFDREGEYARMLVVNGNPAIWYADGDYGKYVRALDKDGRKWGTPQILAPRTRATFSRSFAVVNGHPAVAYGWEGALYFIRAADPNGDTWGSAQTILSADGPYFNNRMAFVDGCPAIAFSAHGGNASSFVRFIRAIDADGITWPSTALEVTTSGDASVEWLHSMAVINGLPSIVFGSGINTSYDPLDPGVPPTYDTTYLDFIQATDASGSAWDPAQTVLAGGGTGSARMTATGSGVGISFRGNGHAVNYVGSVPAPPDPAVNVQLSTDKSSYIIDVDTAATLTAVVTDEYGDPISGLSAGAFVTTLDGGSVSPGFLEGPAGTYTGSVSLTGLTAGDHTVQTTVTDARGAEGSGSATFSMNEAGSGGTMHVGDLDASINNGPHNRWRVVFTVKIGDSGHNAVSGADVSYSLSGDDSGSGQITTGSDGTASYQTGWIKGSGSVTFTVDGVTHATLSYSAGDNHDSDGDSDGTSITATGP